MSEIPGYSLADLNRRQQATIETLQDELEKAEAEVERFNAENEQLREAMLKMQGFEDADTPADTAFPFVRPSGEGSTSFGTPGTSTAVTVTSDTPADDATKHLINRPADTDPEELAGKDGERENAAEYLGLKD